jgi:hypothetical protein
VKCRVTYVTGEAPLLPYHRCMAMTDEQIRAFNDSYYRHETVEFELETHGVERMTDIVEMMRKTANKEFGTYDVADDSVRVGCSTLRDAANEIERLRAKIEAISQVAGKASIEGVTFAQIKGRHADSDVLGKYTGPLLDSMSQTAETLCEKALSDAE